MSRQNFRPSYKWVVLIFSFLMVLLCAGFCCGNKSLYLAAITEALDIPRSTYALTDTFFQISTAVSSLFFGALFLRFGAKPLIISGILLACCAFGINSVTQNVYGFYIGSALLGVGTCFLGSSMACSLIKQWFSNGLGKLTGFVLAANGLGSAISAQVLSPMLNDPADPFGYRNVYRLFLPILLGLGLILLLFLREHPSRAAVNSSPVKKPDTPRPPLPKTDRLVFGFLFVSVFLFFMLIQSIYSIYASYMKDVGMEAGQIATVASILTLALAGSKLLTGILYDKLGLFPVLLICQTAFLAALLILFCLPLHAGLPLAILFALLMALSMPLETVCVPLITSEFFGKEAFERVLGFFTAAGCAGAALGSPIINLCYDLTGSYMPVLTFWLVIIALLIFSYDQLFRKKKKHITHQEALL